MKKLYYLIIAITVLGLIVTGCIPVVPPTEQSDLSIFTKGDIEGNVYVDTNSTSLNEDGSEANPFKTITAALAATTTVDGDTIIVAAGTYINDIWDGSSYRINKSVTLLGAQAGNDPAGSTTERTGEETILVRTNGLPYSLFVSDITIDGFMNGNASTNSGGRFIIGDGADNAIIRNCIIQNTPTTSSGHGVYIYSGAENALVEYNTFYNTAWEAIASGGGPGPEWPGASNAVISHNHISASGQHAIQWMGHAGSNNEITYNHISGIIGKNAIQYWGGPGANISYNVIDGGNTMYDGIWLDAAADGSTVSDNQISDTIYAGINVRGGCTNAVITCNDISGCGTGVVTYGGEATISLNVINGGNDGIWLDADADDSTVSHNQISDTMYAGINVRGGCTGAAVTYNELSGCGIGVETHVGATGASVNYNNIEGNSFGVRNCDPAILLDATRNWWGHASGPGGEFGRTNPAGKIIGKGDEVSDYVNWDPWLSQPTVPPTQILNKWDLEGTFVAHPGYNWGGLAEEIVIDGKTIGATWEYSIHIKEAISGDFSVGSIHFATVDNIIDIEVIGIVEQTKTSYNYSSWANWDTLAAAGRAKYNGETYNFLFLFSEHAMWFAISHCDLEPFWTDEDVWHGLDREYDLLSKIPDETFIVDPKSIH